jgi:hypothetical protein
VLTLNKRVLLKKGLNYCAENKGLIIYSYVIRSNPVHLVILAKEENLSDIFRGFKKFTFITLSFNSLVISLLTNNIAFVSILVFDLKVSFQTHYNAFAFGFEGVLHLQA